MSIQVTTTVIEGQYDDVKNILPFIEQQLITRYNQFGNLELRIYKNIIGKGFQALAIDPKGTPVVKISYDGETTSFGPTTTD